MMQRQRSRFAHALTGIGAILTATAVTACSASGIGVDGAVPNPIRIASYAGPGTADSVAAQRWADLVTEYTDGALEFELFLSSSLLGAADILPSVGNGTVEMGMTSHGYHPGELPLTQLVNLGFVTSNARASAAAMTELYETNEALKAEWDAQGVRPLLFPTQSTGIIGCNDPIEGSADVRGKTVRAVALGAEDHASVGANIVALASPEVLEAIERGVIECWSTMPLELATSLGVAESTSYMYDYGRGMNGGLQMVIGTALWDRLSEEERQAMLRASEEVTAEYGDILAERVTEACDAVEESGGTVGRLSEGERAIWEEAGAPANQAKYLEIAGPQGEEFLVEYLDTVEKFENEYSDYVDPTVTCSERF